jgi:hypothetical protein
VKVGARYGEKCFHQQQQANCSRQKLFSRPRKMNKKVSEGLKALRGPSSHDGVRHFSKNRFETCFGKIFKLFFARSRNFFGKVKKSNFTFSQTPKKVFTFFVFLKNFQKNSSLFSFLKSFFPPKSSDFRGTVNSPLRSTQMPIEYFFFR